MGIQVNKLFIAELAATEYIKRLGYEQYTAFQVEFTTVAYAVTADCPDYARKDIKEVIEGLEMQLGVQFDEEPMNVVTRDITKWCR